MSRDERVDTYIVRQADFARPILEHLREAVHAACPDCEEAIKWGMPAFMYRGRQLAGMAAFKAHATFGFWRGSMILPDNPRQHEAMGHFGRLTSLDDLPEPGVLADLIRKAVALAGQGVKPVRNKTTKAPLEVPEDLRRALEAHGPAAATFDGFSESCRREYVEWVTEAKRRETRDKRIAQAVEWMADGKRRNWKYENC